MTEAIRGEASNLAREQVRLIRVRGIVQGVGYRPFVHGLATHLGVAGEVSNDAQGVVVLASGPPHVLEQFCAALTDQAPPLAVVDTVESSVSNALVSNGFRIVPSSQAAEGNGGRTVVPPDAAPCADCLRELADPHGRRYRHPFISCTACGPRFTISTGVPYDRPMTTMRDFPMCAACAAEYADPSDRRFHAQPICCHDCGPALEYLTHADSDADALAAQTDGLRPVREAGLAAARARIADGGIVAVKGVGGYHLACDATDPAVVARLRARKRRGDKPFAVLVADLATAGEYAQITPPAEDLLIGMQRPVVLLPHQGDGLAGVAPGQARIGVMLPPSPLHTLLLGLPGDTPGPRALVLTSANLAGEPIVTDDEAALTRLHGIADAWLRHNRAIHVPCDDSVVTLAGDRHVPIRRSRGHAPRPLQLPIEVEPTLATGGDLKNTICVGQGTTAWMSAHIGDMDDVATQAALDTVANHLLAVAAVQPATVVTDAHPLYRSRAWAARYAAANHLGKPVAVQHHHAHIAAVLAENGLPPGEDVLGIAFDGTGYGADGAIWGGEALLPGSDYTRLAHLSYVPLPGGDASVHRVYRMAIAHLREAGLDPRDHAELPCIAACPPAELPILLRQLETGLASSPTSSAGRLFDAVASIAGICHEATYEAQAAMELQAAAEIAIRQGLDDDSSYPLPLLALSDQAAWQWDVAALIHAVVRDAQSGIEPGLISVRFHRGLARAVRDLADAARTASRWSDPQRRVALAGGVFCNPLLVELTIQQLAGGGYTVLTHQRLPPNDGSLALGQLVLAATANPQERG